MGDLIPMRDHAAARDAIAQEADSPWFRTDGEAPDWDSCKGCPIRGACREVRECQWPAPPEPDITLRIVDPPDIVA